MTIKTVSLEVGKKLKEAGWGKETFFIHESKYEIWEKENLEDSDFNIILLENKSMVRYYPAPIVSELLDELPTFLRGKEISIVRDKVPTNGKYCWMWIAYYNISNLEDEIYYNRNPVGRGELLEDALALLWIELKEKNII